MAERCLSAAARSYDCGCGALRNRKRNAVDDFTRIVRKRNVLGRKREIVTRIGDSYGSSGDCIRLYRFNVRATLYIHRRHVKDCLSLFNTNVDYAKERAVISAGFEGGKKHERTD